MPRQVVDFLTPLIRVILLDYGTYNYNKNNNIIYDYIEVFYWYRYFLGPAFNITFFFGSEKCVTLRKRT